MYGNQTTAAMQTAAGSHSCNNKIKLFHWFSLNHFHPWWSLYASALLLIGTKHSTYIYLTNTPDGQVIKKKSTKTTWLFHQNQHEFQDRQGLCTDNSNFPYMTDKCKSIISMEHKNSLKQSRKRHSRPFKHTMASISFKGCNKPPLHINNITIIQQQYKYRGNKCLPRFIVLHRIFFKSVQCGCFWFVFLNHHLLQTVICLELTRQLGVIVQDDFFVNEWKQSCNIQIWFYYNNNNNIFVTLD